jgi:hypothetical protein
MSANVNLESLLGYQPQPPPIATTLSPFRLHRTVGGKTTIYPLVGSVTLLEKGQEVVYPTGVKKRPPWKLKGGGTAEIK